jgi:hypothetical protein
MMKRRKSRSTRRVGGSALRGGDPESTLNVVREVV